MQLIFIDFQGKKMSQSGNQITVLLHLMQLSVKYECRIKPKIQNSQYISHLQNKR